MRQTHQEGSQVSGLDSWIHNRATEQMNTEKKQINDLWEEEFKFSFEQTGFKGGACEPERDWKPSRCRQ